MSTFTVWAKDAALRAVKTGAQAAAAAITANTATITHLDFAAIGSIAGLAAVWSVLQNLSHLKVADPDADALVQAVLAKVLGSIPSIKAPAVVFPPTTTTGTGILTVPPGQVTVTNTDLGGSPTVTA